MDNYEIKESILSELLKNIFYELKVKNQEYCICGNYKMLPYFTDNDVDVWAKDTDTVAKIFIREIISQKCNPYILNRTSNGLNIFCWHGNGNNTVELLHFDILSDCGWCFFLPLVRSEQIETNREMYRGFLVANDTVDAAMHFTYTLAHHGRIRPKYYDDIKRASGTEEFRKILNGAFGESFTNYIYEHIKGGQWAEIEQKFKTNKKKLLLRAICHLKFVDLRKIFLFAKSNIKRLLRPTGLFIVFIGPDGCGKTTLLQNLKPFFGRGFAKGKMQLYYWRPFLLPRLRRFVSWGKPINDPPGNPNPEESLKLRNSSLGKRCFHLLKLFYYWVDYIIGRILYQGTWSRAGVVCFDRYWHDLIIFPERFGLNLPESIMKFLGLFVPQPDIIFYLDVSSETLISRKLELPEEEIKCQIRKYRSLAQKNKRIFSINGECSEQEVRDAVIRTCLEKMSQRY